MANPVVRPPADLTVSSCAATRIGTGVAIDICDYKTAMLSNDAPGVFEPGTNRITWRGVVEGSVATAVQTVTVADKTRPEFLAAPADLTLTTCTPGELQKPAAIDDCGGVAVTSDAPAVFPVGPSIVTWTAADQSGNRAATTQPIAVTDQQPPTVYCGALPSAPGIYQVAARDDSGAATMSLRGREGRGGHQRGRRRRQRGNGVLPVSAIPGSVADSSAPIAGSLAVSGEPAVALPPLFCPDGGMDGRSGRQAPVTGATCGAGP